MPLESLQVLCARRLINQSSCTLKQILPRRAYHVICQESRLLAVRVLSKRYQQRQLLDYPLHPSWFHLPNEIKGLLVWGHTVITGGKAPSITVHRAILWKRGTEVRLHVMHRLTTPVTLIVGQDDDIRCSRCGAKCTHTRALYQFLGGKECLRRARWMAVGKVEPKWTQALGETLRRINGNPS